MSSRSRRLLPAMCLSVLFLPGCCGSYAYRYGGSCYGGGGYVHASGCDPVAAVVLLGVAGGIAIFEALSHCH